ncbi:spore coat protein [Sporosarcina sp. YIM B06819]|uniref:spore coat protein n=1 Tax=Sporosarcina sp. YIM B06819 TaxID=3081769 RepID=UPI00298D0F2A|nr:spore coat protein [Sporosarcina sp. YIM B06819]
MTFSNKIENPQTPPPEKQTFNDNEILRAAIATERNFCNSYTTAMLGASHEKLYKLIFEMLKDAAQQHRKLVDLQFQHGWLSLTPAPSEEVKALEKEFRDAEKQLK